ncbi:putative START-like domain-containing protein [Rosa chinensis]|uniref:Putative START-like domain-containing protein n=1 Tax=Rosa chinensis TaxID=74649 RepID=A0A2P6R3D4_ROSCH|nr:MLP-like protein 31 [Rosa chinensis]PRQ40952.1 putative START-like domain-containing protein [Rosa chinensis]
MASLDGKLETEVEISSGADKFYKIFTSQMHLLPNVSSDKIQGVELHEGDWETVGSVKHWDYTLDGSVLSLKETVEAIDEENKSVTFNVVDGEILKHYKSFKVTLKVTEKSGGGGSLVKWILDYEKVSEEIPAPQSYQDFAVKVTEDLEAHLLTA